MVSLTFRQLPAINSLLMHMRIWHDKNIPDHPNAMQVTYLSGLPQRKRESNVFYNHTQIGHSCRDTLTSRQVSNFYGVELESYYRSQIPLTIERFELWTSYPLETGCKLVVHKAFRRRLGNLPGLDNDILCKKFIV